MDIIICQTCGSILKAMSKFCSACGAFTSEFASTSLPALSNEPLSVDKTASLKAEHVVSKLQATTVLDRELDGTAPPVAPRRAISQNLDFFDAAPMKEIRQENKQSANAGEDASAPRLLQPSHLSDAEDQDEQPKVVRPSRYKPKEVKPEPATAKNRACAKISLIEKMQSALKLTIPGSAGFSRHEADVESKQKKDLATLPSQHASFYQPTPPGPSQNSVADPQPNSGVHDLEHDGFDSIRVPKPVKQVALGSFVFAAFITLCIALNSLVGQNLLFATGGMPDLTGKLRMQYRERAKMHSTQLMIKQTGLRIDGLGHDDAGDFRIEGTITPPETIRINKWYQGAKNPVVMEGQCDFKDNHLMAHGKWKLAYVIRGILRGGVHEMIGVWDATFDPDNKNAHVLFNPIDRFNSWWAEVPFSTKLLFAAAVLIACGVASLLGSLFVFSPNGKMNIWAKQKYIPSQFSSQHNKMVRQLSKRLKPGGLPLGRRCEWKPWQPWQAKSLSIPPEIRDNDPHVLILGASDKGKTRLMADMIVHDIESNDRAVIVIDSDGNLSKLVTDWAAAHAKGAEFAKRMIVLDPTFKGNKFGYNPLEMPEDEDLQSAASAIVYGFKAIYTEPPGAQSQWNQQTANILRNAALLLMVNGKTLTDLPALLNDNDFRDILLESVEKRKRDRAEYITLLDTWGQYKRLARTDQWITWVEPILNRVGPMLSDARTRSILTKPVSDIKLRNIIQEKKILIIKVAKGRLDQNANLLGSLIVTGVKQAALSLANEDPNKQPPVALYLDEFDNFIERETIEAITSETDKFKIGFIGCIKTLQHLPEDFRNQLIMAVGTMACFALAKKDGDLLGPQMFRVDGRKIKHQTIQNFFNKVNTSPQFELISDEEKLNIDRVVGQEDRTFFCYRVGTVAGVFHLKSHDFEDVPDNQVKKKLIEKMHGATGEAN